LASKKKEKFYTTSMIYGVGIVGRHYFFFWNILQNLRILSVQTCGKWDLSIYSVKFSVFFFLQLCHGPTVRLHVKL